MRRVLLATAMTASLVLVPAAGAGATHTGGGCVHGVTAHAHATVPHKDNHGTHQAHSSIPYCPPADAPRHKDAAAGH